MYNHRFGEGGHVSESEYLGSIDTQRYFQKLQSDYEAFQRDPARKKEFLDMQAKLSKREPLPPYYEYTTSLNLIRACQRSSPINPEREYANNLRRKVVEELSSLYKKRLSEESVLYYTACSEAKMRGHLLLTPSDFYHGIDAFMDINLDDWRGRVTIDGSTNPNKAERRPKANIVTIWPEGLDSKVNPEEFRQFVDEEAHKITEYVSHIKTPVAA